MAPIHDTDLAEERWTQAEWDRYELWEKIEHRLKRRKRGWIAAIILVFLMISSIPIVRDRYPKWQAMTATRHLAQALNGIKRQANLEHMAFRLSFTNPQTLEYKIERLARCSDTAVTEIGRGRLLPNGPDLVVLSPALGQSFGVTRLLENFCYDPLDGSEPAHQGQAVEGFAVGPAQDLGSARLDRVSVLLVSGSSAELSFD